MRKQKTTKAQNQAAFNLALRMDSLLKTDSSFHFFDVKARPPTGGFFTLQDLEVVARLVNDDQRAELLKHLDESDTLRPMDQEEAQKVAAKIVTARQHLIWSLRRIVNEIGSSLP